MTSLKPELQYWQIDYAAKNLIKISGFHFEPVTNVVKLLNELHFIAINNLAEVQLGADLLFNTTPKHLSKSSSKTNTMGDFQPQTNDFR